LSMKTARFIAAALILILIIPGVLACGNQPAEKAGFNFDLKYSAGGKNEIDTFHGTFTRDMGDAPSITIGLRLSEAEMERIYKKMTDIDFFNYPDIFAVKAAPGEPSQVITPANTYSFTVEKEGQTKTLTWIDEIQTPNDEAANLRELIVMIQRLIEAKEEYKELPNPGSATL
jgi:hypothetical protein